ncbi:PREDICTED: uncharacterized protein K02A2.6-like [Cyphomyrmex costatus]|uniref:uncharacterized protein K02A2.6-like n=1 Tax=Cyphomyrmex costatus TaxID=456900 RepID=UPI000852288C|nr:PREDICTED: uncharacterized protein K02A2.6-like [Cyphomyrmex costatus]
MAQQPIVFFGNVGRLEIYEDGDDWKLYRQRLVQYFVANDVQGNRRVAVLFTSISKSVYCTLNDLCDPELPDSKTFDELCNLLETQFSPRTSVWRKRIEFYKMQQMQDESITKYYARLKSLAALCNFGNDLNNVLRDRFVSGLLSGKILDRLCEETETKTIQELLELALKKETALSEMSTSIHKLNAKQKFQNKHKKDTSTKTKPKGDTASSADQLKCYACGNTNHNFSSCRYKKYRCKTCNGMGHIAKACKKADTSTNYLSDQTEKSEISEKETIEMFSLNIEKTVIEPIKVTIKINGEIFVTANYGKCFVPARLLIVKSEGRPLLGRDLISAFKMFKNFQVKLLAINFKSDKNIENKLSLQSLLAEFADIFKPSIGTYKHEKIQLSLRDNVSPIFCKPRPIPFAFRDLVDAELTKLEKQGVITKVESSRWGTPLVPVLRANKTLRLCANYSLTINPHLEDVNYPLPKIEEIFTAVQGGQKFTKLDFKNAFNQLLLEQSTRELLAWSTHKGIFLVNRLPFGTKPASAIFQMKAENIKGPQRSSCIHR